MRHPSNLDAPITVPAHPFLKVLETFGRDELYAGILSIGITAAMEVGFKLCDVASGSSTALALALAGPIFEKFGFFIGHLRDAQQVYRETPVEDRQSRRYYLKKALRGGAKSLFQDILIHDPIYAALMLGGMTYHPSTPAFLIVPIAFGLAVLLVAALEVSFHELRYGYFQSTLAQFGGFEKETYLESRLFLDSSVDPVSALALIRDRFFPNQEIRTLEYRDRYLAADKLPEFNARCGNLRIRNRTDAEGRYTHVGGSVNTIQLVYTRAVEDEDKRGVVTQFRYFPVQKEKYYRIFVPDTDGLPSSDVQKEVAKITGDNWLQIRQEIRFQRRLVYNDELFVSIDSLENGVHLIEIKAYHAHVLHLKEAMRFVMHHLPATQMTYNKIDLLSKKELHG